MTALSKGGSAGRPWPSLNRPLLWLVLVHAAAVIPEASNVTSVVMEGRSLATYGFASGQFVMVRFLCPRLMWESHPFSLSLPYDGKQLRISVKDVGDFSGAVRGVRPGTRVVLEGPYGIFTSARATSSKVLCLAFGIGITPIRAIAEDLVKEGRDVILIYGSLKSAEIALRREVEDLSARFRMQVHHVLSEESLPSLPAAGPLPPVTVSGGFVTRGYLQRVVPDIDERDVFLCGPSIAKGVPPRRRCRSVDQQTRILRTAIRWSPTASARVSGWSA